MKKILLITVSILCLVTLIVWGSNYQSEVVSDNMNFFNQSHIEGVIRSVGIKNHGSGFKINNDPDTYVFYPYTNKELNEGNIFYQFAKPGDKVMKKANSDTLYLFKEGKTYRYNFEKNNK